MAQLADGGGLARPVDADDQDDVGRVETPDVERLGDRRQDFLDLLRQDRAEARVRRAARMRCEAMLSRIRLRRLGAEVGRRSALPRYRRGLRIERLLLTRPAQIFSPRRSAVFLKPPVRRSSQLIQKSRLNDLSSRPMTAGAVRRSPRLEPSMRDRREPLSLWPFSLFSMSTVWPSPTSPSSQTATGVPGCVTETCRPRLDPALATRVAASGRRRVGPVVRRGRCARR